MHAYKVIGFIFFLFHGWKLTKIYEAEMVAVYIQKVIEKGAWGSTLNMVQLFKWPWGRILFEQIKGFICHNLTLMDDSQIDSYCFIEEPMKKKIKK